MAGAVLGPTFFANFFQATNVIPNIVYEVLAGPVLALVVVPAVVRAFESVGPERARELVRALSGFLLMASGIAAALLVALSPWIADLLTRGVPEGAVRERAAHLTMLLVLFVAPQIVLYTIAFLGAAAQQARSRFALSTLAPTVENVGLTATLVTAAVVYGRGLEVDAVPVGMVVLLGVGSTLSVALHAAVQVVGAARVGLLTLPSLQWTHDPEARALVRYLVRSVRVAAFPAIGVLGLLALAVTVPGGVLVLQMAIYVYNFPVSVGARAVSIAVLPGLSDAARRLDRAAFAASTRQAIVYGLVAGFAALSLLVGLGDPVAFLLAQGELRGTDLVGVLALCVAIVGVAQLVGGLHEVARQALFARSDLDGPRRASAAALVATAVTGLIAIAMPSPESRMAVLCLALLARDLTGAAMLVRRLGRAVRPETILDRRRLAAAALAVTPALPIGLLGTAVIETVAPGRIFTALLLAGFGALVLVAYGGTFLLAGRARVRWTR
ncbi:lipid II flippase MurJ [Actinomycetospora straminea]|uniref:lipid II flippase MurJ n=1 Tax=Actinomycetospora straminea TaxID=663607 RepID=UPI00236690A3|nr:lipid II flippase MurJ [Actinomycetospora straminea]MDD7931046.1 lipid II flippase MurJ [Actinomycetospora straminea]